MLFFLFSLIQKTFWIQLVKCRIFSNNESSRVAFKIEDLSVSFRKTLNFAAVGKKMIKKKLALGPRVECPHLPVKPV